MDSNNQGFPQVLRTWGTGGFSKFVFFFLVRGGGVGGGGADLSQYMGGAWEQASKKRENISLISAL